MPIAASDTPSPNHTVPAAWSRSQKARWKNRNPIEARINPIAEAASTIATERSSSRSWKPLASRRHDLARQPPRHEERGGEDERAQDERRFRADELQERRWQSAATKPATPEMMPSFEFASTSSVSDETTVGTSADFDTVDVFESTRAAKARGNRRRLSR